MTEGEEINLCGIDEAGYGPMFGPLCVSAAVFRIARREGRDGAHGMDLWDVLADAVARLPSEKGAGQGRRLPVNDSKKLKLANASESKHPCHHLERGVLTFLLTLGLSPTTDLELFGMVGAALEEHAWYAGAGLPCPVSGSVGEIGILSNLVRRCMQEQGVMCRALRCETICEGSFNEGLQRSGSKAAVSAFAVRRHMQLFWEDHVQGGQAAMNLAVCDRQGGRTDYSGFLAKAFPGADVVEREQGAAKSLYEVRDGGRAMTVLFTPEADSLHLPVALASMLAKLVREMAMARFNRYWSGIIPELKPTAGYTQDARRWLRDAGRAVTPAIRRDMVRRA